MARWQDWASLILGLCLFFTPWLTGDAPYYLSATNDWIVGFLIFIICCWTLAWPYAPEIERLNMVLAVWLFTTPFWMDGVQAEKVVCWIVGFLVFALSVSASAAAPRTP